jgi:hypothetical protein
MRRVLIGFVAIPVVTGALTAGHAVGAKPAKSHHAQCASRSSKAEHGKLRRECKKPRKTPKKLTRAEKLRKALKACKTDKSKAKRKACERWRQPCFCGPLRVRPPHPGTPEEEEEEERRLRESREVAERERQVTGPTGLTGPTGPTGPAGPTGPTTTTPEAPTATLVVEVEGCGGPPPGRCESLNNPVDVRRLGPANGDSIMETSEHAFRVVPGLYEVTVEAGGASQSKQVGVSAGPETLVNLLIDEP